MRKHKNPLTRLVVIPAVTLTLFLGVSGCSNMKAVSAASKGDLGTLQTLRQEGKNLDRKGLGLTTPLYKAIEQGNVKVASFVLEGDVDIDRGNGLGGYTALMAAVRNDDDGATAMLLGAGADPNINARGGETALHMASRAGDLDRVDELLRAGADPAPAGKDGRSPLMIAMRSEQPDMIGRLLQAGPDLEVKHQEETVLMKAVKSGKGGVVARLLEAGADPATSDSLGNPPALYAILEENRTLLSLLLAYGMDVDLALPPVVTLPADAGSTMEGGSLLTITTRRGWKDGVLLLLGNGAAVDMRAMKYAITRHESPAILAQMLAAGADPDGEEGWVPLSEAVNAGRDETVKVLLAAGADPGPQATARMPHPPLNVAAGQGSVDMVSELLAAGAPLEQKTVAGFHALYQSAYNGHVEVLKLLIAAGADVNSINGEHYTPLMAAADNRNKTCVAALLAAGADPNITTKEGFNALYYAVKKNAKDIPELLLVAGADPDLPVGQNKWTPAHQAAYDGSYEVLETLLKYGANPNARSSSGDTPMDKALRKGWDKTPKVIARYGGRINRYDPSSKKGNGFETAMKVFATASVAAAGAQANIPDANYADVMTATVRDIWVEDGKGNNLAGLMQQYSQGNTEIRDPVVREIFEDSIRIRKETEQLKQQQHARQQELRRRQQLQQQALEERRQAMAEQQRQRQQNMKSVQQELALAAGKERAVPVSSKPAPRSAPGDQQAKSGANKTDNQEKSRPRKEPRLRTASIRRGARMNESEDGKLNCDNCKGTLTRRNLSVGDCQVKSLTVAYEISTFFGEPLVKGDYKWQAGLDTAADCLPYKFAVWLEIENSGYGGYIEIDPVVPDAGDVSFSGTAGSPDWDNFICGFEGDNRVNCFGEDESKTLMQNARITGFDVSLE